MGALEKQQVALRKRLAMQKRLSAAEQEVAAKMRARLVEEAHLYAAYDKSDPFVMGRICAHIRVGICNPRPALGPHDHLAGEPGAYTATKTTVQHTITVDGRDISFPVASYSNAKRP